METSVVEEKLSDGSSAFNVVFVDGSQRVVIAAIDERSAALLQLAIRDYAAYATVDAA